MIDFIGVADLATFLGVAPSSLNTALANLATAASQQKIRKYLDQEITYHVADLVYLDGNGKTKIRLPERPVRSVALVEEGSGDPVWTTLSSDAYTLRGSVLIRWDDLVWMPGVANLRVTYTHGWNVGQIDSDTSDSDYDVGVNNIPADISLVALSLARRMYQNMGAAVSAATAGGQIRGETIGNYSYTLSDAAIAAGAVNLSDSELAVLAPYRMIGSG